MRQSPPSDPGLARLARRALAGLLVGTALFRLSQNMGITTLSLLARQEVHLSAADVGLLGSLAGLTVALFTLLVSRRVPHTAAGSSAALGMVVLLGGLVGLGLASSFPDLLLGTLLLGTAGGITMPGLLNAVVAESPSQRERVIALYALVLSVSLVVGPLIETVVLAASHQDVRVPFLAFAALPGVGAILVAGRHGLRGRTRPARSVPANDPTTPPSAASPPIASRLAGTGGRTGRPRTPGLLSSRDGQDALLAQLLYAIPFAGVTVFGALVARVGYGVSPAAAQAGFTVFFLCSLGARAVVAWRAPINAKKGVLWLAAALTAAGLLLLGTGSDPAELFVAMAILGIPHGLTYPLALALVADATPVERLPGANATLIGSTSLTSVLVPLVLGALVSAVGYKAMMLVMLGPVALFALARLGLARRRPAAVAPRLVGEAPEA